MYINVFYRHHIHIPKNLTTFSNPKKASIQAYFIVCFYKSMISSINIDKDF